MRLIKFLGVGAIVGLFTGSAVADRPTAKSSGTQPTPAARSAEPMSFQQSIAADDSPAIHMDEHSMAADKGAERTAAPVASSGDDNEDGYHEVSDFFNIREANPQVGKGEWEFEVEGFWFTHSNHHDDDFAMEQSIKYGITNSFFIELEVTEPNIGDGGDQGNGDLNVVLFKRFMKEIPGEQKPAIAGYAELRFPTGDGSRGTDALFSGVITKHLGDGFRAHFQAYLESANGGSSEDEDYGRRPFQWGFGPGFDYQIDEKTLVLINYLNKSSDQNGQHNNNILELGLTRQIAHTERTDQLVKIAADIGLDGQDETPNFGVKLLWEIGWK